VSRFERVGGLDDGLTKRGLGEPAAERAGAAPHGLYSALGHAAQCLHSAPAGPHGTFEALLDEAGRTLRHALGGVDNHANALLHGLGAAGKELEDPVGDSFEPGPDALGGVP